MALTHGSNLEQIHARVALKSDLGTDNVVKIGCDVVTRREHVTALTAGR